MEGYNRKYSHQILVDDFNSKSESEKKAYEIMAERDLERSRTLFDEVKDVLLKTKGKIRYQRIADHLKNIV